MKQTELTLLALLRASLYGIPAALQSDTDWDAVLSEANAQTVTALAAHDRGFRFDRLAVRRIGRG